MTKLLLAAMNGINPKDITSNEKDVICEVLKRRADQRTDWSDEQKMVYKALADYVKSIK